MRSGRPSTEHDHLAVADAMEALPPYLRRLLAHGPMDEPECRICTTLKHVVTEDAKLIMEFHELGDEGLAEAARDALGRDRRLDSDERAAALGYKRKLEGMPERNVQRRTVESLAGNLMWWRALYVYLLAGWRP